MRWSIEELISALRFYKESYWKRKVQYFFRYRWRRFKVFVHWLFKGYTKEHLWDLNYYFYDVILFRLKKFKIYNINTYPAVFDSHVEWMKELDLAIELLERIVKGDSSPDDVKEFNTWFSNNIESLWD